MSERSRGFALKFYFWAILIVLLLFALSCATVPTNMQERCTSLGGEVTEFGCLFRPDVRFELGRPASGNPLWDCRQLGGIEDRFGQCSAWPLRPRLVVTLHLYWWISAAATCRVIVEQYILHPGSSLCQLERTSNSR